MQKVDKPKKPLFVYYLIVLAVIVLLNLFLFPELGRAACDGGGLRYIFDNAEATKRCQR